MNKIVWLTNIPLPIFYKELNISKIENGSWMTSLFLELINNKDIALYVYSPSQEVTKFRKYKNSNFVITLFPQSKKDVFKYNNKLEFFFENELSSIKPNVIHCHGTEYPHTLAMIKASKSIKTIVSIQGVISLYAKVYFSNINKFNLIKHSFTTLNSVFMKYNKFLKRKPFEIESLKRANIILGRTDWDYNFIKSLGLSSKYQFMPEIPLELFNSEKWTYNKCIPFSIFFSQATYPIKGFHFIILALIHLKKEFPTIKLNVAGRKIYKKNYSFLEFLRLDEYDKFILNLLHKNMVFENISFLGEIDPKQVLTQLLNSNVYVNSSIIENSPNSMAEAISINMPILVSNVGGISTILKNYPFFTFEIENQTEFENKLRNVFNSKAKVSVIKQIPIQFSKEIALKNIKKVYEIQ